MVSVSHTPVQEFDDVSKDNNQWSLEEAAPNPSPAMIEQYELSIAGPGFTPIEELCEETPLLTLRADDVNS